jgi:hypothetical protein
LPRRRARDQQIRHIEALNQQHQSDYTHEHYQRGLIAAAQEGEACSGRFHLHLPFVKAVAQVLRGLRISDTPISYCNVWLSRGCRDAFADSTV